MNDKFDWTTILPDAERQKVLAGRQAFFDNFPTKDEVEQAGREGREAFAKACAQVDRAELRKLQAIIDDQADRILDLEAALSASNGDQQ